MIKNLSLMLAGWLAVPSLALAQTGSPTLAPTGSDIQEDRQEVRGDRKEMQSLDAKHADAVKDLNAKEKAAMDAVKDDKNLTPAQRKEKLAALRQDFNARRKGLNEKFRADKRAIQRDMKKDRADIRRDERAFRSERQDLHRDMHREMGRENHAVGRR